MLRDVIGWMGCFQWLYGRSAVNFFLQIIQGMTNSNSHKLYHGGPLACGSQIYKLDKINSAAKNDIQNPVVYYAVFSPGLGDRTNWQEAPSHIWFLFHGRVLQPTHSFS